jgi:hypothetical protein
VYVDDNWTVCDDDDEWDTFHTAWKQEFVESANVEAAANDFCGVTTIDLPDGSVAMSSKKLLLSMQALIDEYQQPAHIGTPMLGDSPALMREKGGPVLEHLVSKARSIVGLGLFVVRGTRPDALFAGVTVSQHIVNNLTPYVWECLLRWAYYLTTT